MPTQSKIRRSATRALLIGATALLASALNAQPAEPTNGPREVALGWHALTGATVTTAPGNTVENATVVVRDGVIVSVREGGNTPDGARVWPCDGMHITPAFVEPFFGVDAPDPEEAGAHWNPMVTPQRSALDGGGISEGDAKKLRAMGFAAANITPNGGIFRGRSAVVSLHSGDTGSARIGSVLVRDGFHAASLDRRRGGYPGSQMGAIALARQTLADTGWHAQARETALANPADAVRPEDNDAVAALADDAPIMWDVDNELEALRAIRLSEEFGRTPMIVGSGTEFRRLRALTDSGASLIIPLTYPRKPLVETIAQRELVTLRELQTWEQAPSNAWRLDEAGAMYAFTTSKRRKGEKFHANLRKAIEHTLSEEAALRALTVTPAEMLGVSHLLGTIEPGKLASFIVTDKPIFQEGSEIRDVWIDGMRHVIKEAPAPAYEGEWLVDGNEQMVLTIGAKKSVKVVDARHGPDDKKTYKGRNVSLVENRLSFDVDSEISAIEGASTLVDAVIERGVMYGTITEPDGSTMDWTATLREDADESDDKDTEDTPDTDLDLPVPYELATPLGAFGAPVLPFQDSMLVTNATIWTCGPEGVIENGWLIVDDKGTIEYVGTAQDEIPKFTNFVIDAEGKHVTPGLIDCHSHTGISRGVNEGTQAVTSEVRIADVIDPDAIGWYRQLAGGITAVNQLHGSANPIGGQNSVVKARWGVDHPDDMRLDGAIGGIKFALGENVKQSNWGRDNNTRYPQTRMGVETLIRDRFVAAREYDRAMKAHNARSDRGRTLAPRRDLELEAIAEIINGERLIHCHSYRQDEILMLCRLAEEFGFKIGTFQHVLEGYKVAEAIKENAIGGSSFSDWWAYKFEVIDAIPENGAIMHEVGVVVSFNSDSNELARRMNTEAAKAVKYGGVSEEEALKFVTINPAKQLMVDDRIGSLEVGKDADFVIWSGHPLSTASRPERTVVDSRLMFSLETDAELRQTMASERQRLIQKILTPETKKDKDEEKDDDAGDAKPELADKATDLIDGDNEDDPESRRFSMLQRMTSGAWTDEALEHEYRWLLENGFDPSMTRCGDCGCSVHSLFQQR